MSAHHPEVTVGSRPIADVPTGGKLPCHGEHFMSRDAKNSILLWVGTLAFFGLFWASVHFDIGGDIPDGWLTPLLGVAIGVNVLKFAWDYWRKHKGTVR